MCGCMKGAKKGGNNVPKQIQNQTVAEILASQASIVASIPVRK